MSYDTLLEHTIQTYRLQQGAGVQKVYQQNLVDQPCMIQPLSPEFATRLNMTFGRSYNCFVPLGTDMQKSDKVIDQNGKEYRVSGSLLRNYGANAHLTFFLTETAGDSMQ